MIGWIIRHDQDGEASSEPQLVLWCDIPDCVAPDHEIAGFCGLYPASRKLE